MITRLSIICNNMSKTSARLVRGGFDERETAHCPQWPPAAGP